MVPCDCVDRHDGVYIVRGKEDSLVTRNFVPGKTVYNEKLVKVDVRAVVIVIVVAAAIGIEDLIA